MKKKKENDPNIEQITQVSFHKSLKNINCIWFNLNSIDKYFSTTDSLLNVKLINGSNITINCSNYIFNNQYLKALRLKSILKKNC